VAVAEGREEGGSKGGEDCRRVVRVRYRATLLASLDFRPLPSCAVSMGGWGCFSGDPSRAGPWPAEELKKDEVELEGEEEEE